MPEYRDALIYIHEELKGKDWNRFDGWLGNDPLFRWYGVFIAEGQIKELNLNDNKLKGELLESRRLLGLSQLIILRLSCNMLTGSMNFISYFQDLEELNLSWNKLSGNIPESLYKCTKLRVLRLDNNNLSGIVSKDLSRLVNLRYLDLSRNSFEGHFPIKECGPKLVNLFYILLSGNKFEGFVPKLVEELREAAK